MSEWDDLTRGLVLRLPGAPPETLGRIEATLPCGMLLPEDYRSFIQASDGAEGWVGGSPVNVWSSDVLVQRNEGYQIGSGLFAFGDDGGGELYAFESGLPIQPDVVGTGIVEIPELGPPNPRDYARFLGVTFTDFLRALAARPRPTLSRDEVAARREASKDIRLSPRAAAIVEQRKSFTSEN